MSQPSSAPSSRHIRGPARFLLWLVTCQRRRVAAAAALGVVWMLSLAAPPYLLGRAIDDGLVRGDGTALVTWATALFVAGIATAVLGIARHRTMTKVRMDASFRTTRSLVRHTGYLGNTLHRRITAGEVVAVGITDTHIIAQALTVTGPGVGAVVTYGVVAAILFSISPQLALAVLIGVPVLAITLGPLLRRIVHVGADYRELQSSLSTRLTDILGGLRVLNGLGSKDTYAHRYGKDSRALCDKGYHLGASASWVGAFASGLPALFLAVVVWLAARLAAQGSITVGDLVAVYGYVAILIVPVSFFIEGSGDIARAVVAARRVIRVLRLRHDHAYPARDPAGSVGATQAPLGPAALCDPDSAVEVPAGWLTVLACDRPADANAIIDRLGGFARSAVTWGHIRLDEITVGQIRHRILVADNDADIFTGTVREVVAARHQSVDDELVAALQTAVAADVVEELGDGLDSRLDAHGANVSGGQRQRLRLARAVYADPEVLLAHEPTSAVDAHTEDTVASQLRTARQARTTVICSTSPLVLRQADRVVHVRNGTATGVGTHEELLRSAPDYRRLVWRHGEDTAAS